MTSTASTTLTSAVFAFAATAVGGVALLTLDARIRRAIDRRYRRRAVAAAPAPGEDKLAVRGRVVWSSAREIARCLARSLFHEAWGRSVGALHRAHVRCMP